MRDRVEMSLQSLSERRYTTAEDAMAALAEAAAIVNQELQTLDTTGLSATTVFSGGLRDRLSRWIRRLADMAESISRQFSGASYSISVGLSGVSVGVSWSTGQPRP